VALRENVPTVQCEVLTGSGENVQFILQKSYIFYSESYWQTLNRL